MNPKSHLASLYHIFLENLSLENRRKIMFVRAHKKWPNFREPKSFSEKIVSTALFDKRENFAWTCDKLQMKIHSVELCPGIKPVPTVWSGTDLSELAHVNMPERWVLKPNHLAGGVILIGEGAAEIASIRAQTKDWLRDDHLARMHGEWPYQRADKAFILEPWIGGVGLDDVPNDYKVFVFHGVPHLIQAHTGRGQAHKFYFYDTEWNPVDVKTSKTDDGFIERPAGLNEMLRQAGEIGKAFEFIRVDFYDVDGIVYFGETTPYPASGNRRFDPWSFDLELGSKWILPERPSAAAKKLGHEQNSA